MQGIKSLYVQENALRQGILDRARFCASLTKPHILPPDGHDSNDKLPEPYSSLAARGITNLEGRLLMALYPPGRPFFSLRPASSLLYSPDTDPDTIQQIESILSLHEHMIMAQLEKKPQQLGNMRRTGFRSTKRAALSQLLVTGDVLEQITDDYQIKLFRRDQYVTKRDSSGSIMHHIVRERIDPLTLDPERLFEAGLDMGEMMQIHCVERMMDLYTRCAWQPMSNTWLITQELNENTIHQEETEISPFLCTAFELAPGEHYGRGMVELNLGDIRSMNELTMAILDFSATASKQLFAVDYNSQVRAEDLAKPTGSVIQARVQSGAVLDVAMVQAGKVADFQVTAQTRENVRRDLASVMLMEGEATPTGERVTAFQVRRVAQELEGALGGIFAPIADAQQQPLVERVRFMMERDQLLPKLPKDSIEVETLTGVAALASENDSSKILQILQVLGQLGPEAMSRVNMDVLIDTLMRQQGIHEPGLVKTPEQIAEEQQAAQQAAVQQQAAQQMIQSGGRIIEEQAIAEE